MSEAELRLAITGPAAEADLAVEPALVDAVIAELREGPAAGLGSGVLPLMSQAMAATWEHREGSELTLRAYRRAGGVADAVNRSAQAAYDALTGQQKDAARLVFTQLTVITLDGQFARRRCTRTDLHSARRHIEDIDAVINAFSAQRLLILGQDSVEISHDALLQAWKQLRDWLGDDQLDRALYSQVVTDADTWADNSRSPSYLYQPGRLATIDAAATRWHNAPTRYPPLLATSKAFLDAAHHAARRSARRRRAGFATLAMLTALAVAAAGVAFSQRAAVIQQRNQVIYNQVIAEALQFGTVDTPLAAQLTLAAYRIQPSQDLASRLLNTESTPLPTPLRADAGLVTSVAFSPDGHTLASGDSEGTIQLWDLAQPAQPRPLGQPLASAPGAGQVGGPDSVTSVAFSPNGHTLASGDSEGTIQLWNLADPAHPQPLGSSLTGTNTTFVDSVAFSPDGHTLASDADGTIQLWNVTDPAHPSPLGERLTDGSGAVESVAFSPDGRTLASDGDGTIQLWNLADPAHPQPLGSSLTGTNTTFVDSVAFSPDGHTLASSGLDGTIQLWNVADPAHPSALGPIASGGTAVESLAFSPDGHTLASSGLDGTIQLWNVADPAHPSPLGERLTDGSGAAESVAFSPDGHTLASGGLDGVIRLWNLPQTILTGGAGGLNSVAFSPDGHTLADSDYNGMVQLWNVADPVHPRALSQIPINRTAAADSVAFSPDGHTLASGDSDGTIRLWDVTDPAHPRPLGSTLTSSATVVDSVAFSPDGHTLASGDSDGSIRLWDVTDPARPRQIGPILTDGSGAAVASVTFSSARHLLASGDYGGTIRLWEVADPAEPRPLGVAEVPAASVYSVAFSRDGYKLASGDSGGTVQLWDVTDPTNLRSLGKPLSGGGTDVISVAFSPDGSTLASGDDGGTIQLWDVADPAGPRPLGEPLTGGSVAVDSVAFSPDGHTLASGSDDGTIRLWNLNVQYAINRICAAAGGLTPQQWNEYIPQLRYQPLCAS